MRESGQTLIETIVAIFVLTTGLAAGLALAIYAFGTSADIAMRITATGLAREGIEVMRRMRDSNWLAGHQVPPQLTSCPAMGAGQMCYPNWLTSPYRISGATGSGVTYRVNFSAGGGAKWSADNGIDYQLRVQPGGALSHALAGTPTSFFRKIIVVHQNTADPTQETQVVVRAVVWWWGKNCPSNIDYNPPSTTTPCKIVTEEVLSNWKNY